MLGGVPALLGGGGLELQMERTAAALRRRGHDVRDVRAFEPGDAVDIVHAFNHTGDVAHAIEHWRQTPAGLVFSPVLVVQPSHEWRTRIGKHLPIPTFPARALRDLLRASDAVVALTEWERAFMTQHGPVPAERVVVVGNGVDPVAPGAAPAELPERFLVSVGAVSPRKHQLEVAEALASGEWPYVIVGGSDGIEPAVLDRATEATGGRWLGQIGDPARVRAIVERATALVLLSEREGQSLAVLESIAAGTPVIASDLPSHRELQARWPGWVTIVDGPADVEAAASGLRAGATPPAVPTWDDVAGELEQVYRRVAALPARTGAERLGHGGAH